MATAAHLRYCMEMPRYVIEEVLEIRKPGYSSDVDVLASNGRKRWDPVGVCSLHPAEAPSNPPDLQDDIVEALKRLAKRSANGFANERISNTC